MNTQILNSGKLMGLCIPLILLGALLLPSQGSHALPNDQQPDNQGKRKITLRTGMPKGIKVVAMRNYDDDEWYNKLEFEIKNESGKDIWHMEFLVRLPEYARSDKESLAFVSTFGTVASNPPSKEELKNPNYPLLHPNQTHVFRIPQFQVENFKKLHSPDGKTVPSVQRLQFQLFKVYFTDGTGFVSGRPITLKDGIIKETPTGVVLGPSLPAPKSKPFSLSRTSSSFSSFFCQSWLPSPHRLTRPHSGAWAKLDWLAATIL
ncbi:MAG: hypothetical protein KF868_19245, partial [Acidobacteria bacterium]|nr:hypothetical protein [Acidobacteriota bacterium]MCW5970730.1 hypothetical protein [Blastocatellales bacterium]